MMSMLSQVIGENGLRDNASLEFHPLSQSFEVGEVVLIGTVSKELTRQLSGLLAVASLLLWLRPGAEVR